MAFGGVWDFEVSALRPLSTQMRGRPGECGPADRCRGLWEMRWIHREIPSAARELRSVTGGGVSSMWAREIPPRWKSPSNPGAQVPRRVGSCRVGRERYFRDGEHCPKRRSFIPRRRLLAGGPSHKDGSSCRPRRHLILKSAKPSYDV